MITYPVFRKYKAIIYRCFQHEGQWFWSYHLPGKQGYERVVCKFGSPSCYVAERLAKASIDERLEDSTRVHRA